MSSSDKFCNILYFKRENWFFYTKGGSLFLHIGLPLHDCRYIQCLLQRTTINQQKYLFYCYIKNCAINGLMIHHSAKITMVVVRAVIVYTALGSFAFETVLSIKWFLRFHLRGFTFKQIIFKNLLVNNVGTIWFTSRITLFKTCYPIRYCYLIDIDPIWQYRPNIHSSSLGLSQRCGFLTGSVTISKSYNLSVRNQKMLRGK